jgi:NitT/TauT family transport system substrate-binding protein
MTALLAGQIDIGYVGPSPSVNAYIQSNGTGLVILAGVTSGGAVFVVQSDSGIESADDLGGKTFGAPNPGNTQDVALRYYLMEQGYRTTDQTPAGNVTVKNSSPAGIVTMFCTHQVDGAWLPEPYGEALIQQCGGRLFLDERSLWPDGTFSTAVLVVRKQFLLLHPDAVRAIVSVDINETIWISQHLSQAATDLNATIFANTGQGFSQSILNASLSRLTFTYQPLKTSVATQAMHAYELGWLAKDPTNLTGLYDLSILNSVLVARGLPPVD